MSVWPSKPVGNTVVVSLDEWSRLMWAIKDTDDERVRQAWEQAVQSAVVQVESPDA